MENVVVFTIAISLSGRFCYPAFIELLAVRIGGDLAGTGRDAPKREVDGAAIFCKHKHVDCFID